MGLLIKKTATLHNTLLPHHHVKATNKQNPK